MAMLNTVNNRTNSFTDLYNDDNIYFSSYVFINWIKLLGKHFIFIIIILTFTFIMNSC